MKLDWRFIDNSAESTEGLASSNPDPVILFKKTFSCIIAQRS